VHIYALLYVQIIYVHIESEIIFIYSALSVHLPPTVLIHAPTQTEKNSQTADAEPQTFNSESKTLLKIEIYSHTEGSALQSASSVEIVAFVDLRPVVPERENISQ